MFNHSANTRQQAEYGLGGTLSANSNMTLSNVKLSNVKLSNMTLSNVRLSNVKLSNVRLSNVKLSNVKLSNVKLSNVKPSNVKPSNVRGEMLTFSCSFTHTLIIVSSGEHTTSGAVCFQEV